jgi:hypothetical protein
MSHKRNTGSKKREDTVPSPARHESQCTICAHPQREEIDRDFVDWASSTRISKDYKLARTSLYRHAHATGLFPKRRKNVRTALEKIIERASEVKANAAAVVSAVQAYAKINSQGQWIDRSETVNLNELFDRMTRDELETYARDGTLPKWFPVRAEQEFDQNAS